MLIKKSDNRDADVLDLRRLLDCQISAKQRFLIEREIKCIGSGIRGEESSAYYLDFRYKDSPRWAVVHDLRLEHNGFVAQIDHLLINRFLDVYVLESKNYYYGIKISPEGEFLVWNGKAYVGVESPIEQNRRHISLLEKVVSQPGFLPTRLGISMPMAFHNYVLVAPNSRIDRPTNSKFDSSMVIKADALVEAIGKRVDGMGVVESLASAAKMVSAETLEALACSLANMHKPAKFNYTDKFGVTIPTAQSASKELPDSAVPISNEPKNKNVCGGCGADVDSKVVYFCRFNKTKFGGKTLCQACQKTFTPSTATKTDIVELTDIVEVADGNGTDKMGACEGCGSPVDKKVAFFCRMNKKKFSGKILCRSCQGAS
jgi:Nuclease-related domain